MAYTNSNTGGKSNNVKLAKRTQLIAPSATMAMDALAKDMVRQGIDVISFGVGEPDFETPENVREAARQAIESGKTRYTPAGGIHELKVAVQAQFLAENGLDYDVDEIMITVGAKHALYNLMQVLLNPGDEVIVFAPYWVSYIEQIRLAGATPVVVETTIEDRFVPRQDALMAAISPKTKMIVLNSPSNPTGAVCHKKDLEIIADVALKHNLVVVSDEIYQPFIYGTDEKKDATISPNEEKHVSIASLSPEMKRKTFVVHGVSKSHAMTGWRIGWVAGDKEAIQAMTSLQSHCTSNPSSVSQWAALEAITGPQDQMHQMVKEFAARREYLVGRVRGLSGATCALPEGAFYVFPHVEDIFGATYNGKTINSSADLCQLLLHEAHVSFVPGSAFGAEGYVRISYATSMDNIKRGLDRVERVWNVLQKGPN